MAESCISLIPSVRDFSQQVLWSLRITNSTIGLLNVFGNSLLIYALKKTGQTATISLQLIIVMSVSDVINGTAALSLTNIILWGNYDSYCYLKATTQFLIRLFLGFLYGIVILIALDRFLHIKYLQRYPIIMPKRRMRCLTCLTFLCSTVTAFFSSMPFLKVYMKFGNMVHTALAALAIITVFVLYYKTTKAINRRVSSMNNFFMQRMIIQTKTLVNVALHISICTLLILTSYIIANIRLEVSSSHRAQNTTELAIFKWATYLGVLGTGVCSCVIFVLYNRPVRRFIIMKIFT